jgi:hypothetical protein
MRKSPERNANFWEHRTTANANNILIAYPVCHFELARNPRAEDARLLMLKTKAPA